MEIETADPQGFFTMILGRYNELALKSPKVRGRMESTLVHYVIKMCEREGIQVIKGERLWGRLIFHFNPKDIPKALRIFPYLIGLHSFSPAFQLPSEFETIKESVVKFADTYLCDGDRFAVRAHRVKAYPIKSSDMEREIGGEIFDRFSAQSKKLKVDLEHPDKTIYIDVREKFAHVFIEKIPTIWGGNPIEPDKAVLAFWHGQPYDALASHIFIRRGSIVLPVILQSNHVDNKSNLELINSDLKLLAKFNPEMGHAITINIEPLKILVAKSFSAPNLYEDALIHCLFHLLTELLAILNKERQFHYYNQVLQFKGVVSSARLYNQPYFYIGQQFALPHFMPLTGLSDNIVQVLDRRFRGEETPSKNMEYILADTILEEINPSQTNSTMRNETHVLSVNPELPLVDATIISQIQSTINQEEMNAIIAHILAEKQIITIEGHILCE